MDLTAAVCLFVGFCLGTLWERYWRGANKKSNAASRIDRNTPDTGRSKAEERKPSSGSLEPTQTVNRSPSASSDEGAETHEPSANQNKQAATLDLPSINSSDAHTAATEADSATASTREESFVGFGTTTEDLQTLLDSMNPASLFWVSTAQDPLVRQYLSPGWKKLMGSDGKIGSCWQLEVHGDDVGKCREVRPNRFRISHCLAFSMDRPVFKYFVVFPTFWT
jgi:hypothetical protein